MARKQRPVGEQESEILRAIPAACANEAAAVELIEQLRWGGSPACPRCGDVNVAKMLGKNGARNARFLWRCHGCKQQFTVRIGSIFEDSRIPLRIWCHGFWRACSSKKGVSALQISRETGITYKSALFLMHRIRFSMGTDHSKPPKLTGIVEADETYVGGKPRQRFGFRPAGALPNPATGKRFTGRGTKKTPVFAIVQRGGDVRLSKLDRITAPTLLPAIWEAVSPEATLMTDELGAYHGAGRRLKGGHYTVKHSAGQYVDGRNGEVHSNTVESVFSLIKRGLIGTFHSISKKHLPLYLNEFEFRWNTRYIDDGERTLSAIRQADGKRLRYADHARSV